MRTASCIKGRRNVRRPAPPPVPRTAFLGAGDPLRAFLDIRSFDGRPRDAVRSIFAPWVKRMLAVGIVEGFPVNILGVRREMLAN
jgi:hypothetical protein